MKRTLTPYILSDLQRKLVLISGPRQCGKTTLAKQLRPDYDYFNYDAAEDREILREKAWDRSKPLIIFDELHKQAQWKRWLKGVYDTEGIPPELLVTGSAKLDMCQKAGDSLAGRYFQYRLHPLDLKEAVAVLQKEPELLFEQLWQCSGFPEPFLENSENFYRRWRRSHLDIILRQDMLDLHAVRDIQAIETLIALLKKRVGASVSYANLARDLERDATTIKRWLGLLENLYIVYAVRPYHRNIARSLLKEPKYYFYDHAQVDNDPGARLENIVANALLKELHFLEDTSGRNTALHYLRTKDGQEIDFLVCIDEQPTLLLEVKMGNGKPASGFKHFSSYFPKAKKLQLVKNLSREQTYPDGLEVRLAASWLANFKLLGNH